MAAAGGWSRGVELWMLRLAWRGGREGEVVCRLYVLNYSVLAGMDDLGVGAMRTGLKSLHWMTMFVKCTQGDMDGQTKQNH
jgi:hypothetical protein